MPYTNFQLKVINIISELRRVSGDSYVAGGVALNELASGYRISRDLDLFHDSREALQQSFEGDREALLKNGFTVTILRQAPSFIEVLVTHGSDTTVVQWSQDSAYRFFPLIQHPLFGMTLHPIDAATNKILALIGRHEVRDWVDIISCHTNIQHLGLLAFTACGKDPGFSPLAIIDYAAQSAHYTEVELNTLDFTSAARPSASELSQRWHTAVREARELLQLLPAPQSGKVVMRTDGTLDLLAKLDIKEAINSSKLKFHPGRIKGAFPILAEIVKT